MNKSLAEQEAEALKKCGDVPFRAPGHIQSFGCLIGVDLDVSKIEYVSRNVEEYFDFGAEEIIGKSPSVFLSNEHIHEIRNMAGRSTANTQRQLIGEYKNLKIAGHVRGETIIIELTREGDIAENQSQGLDRLRWLTSKISHEAPLPVVVEEAVRHLRSFSGYDRVKAYRFRPDGSGEVIAESRVDNVDSFLGLRFPAFDIPENVKQLYVKTPIRMIYDVDAEPIEVLSAPKMPELDLSLAVLRGSMPVHSEYLKNMGVSSTLTLPIVVNNKLWGLFAFHHYCPRYVGGGVDLAIEFAGQYLSMVISNAISKQIVQSELDAIKIVNTLFSNKDNHKAKIISWEKVKLQLSNLMPCCGVAYCYRDKVHQYGTCPPEDSLNLLKAIMNPIENNLYITDEIANELPKRSFNGVAGALLIQSGEFFIWFFRRSSDSMVSWAGSPEKELINDGEESRLNPRSSFEAYKISADGKSDSWETSDVIEAKGLYRAINRAQSELVIRDSILENLELVTQELNHRVRNILALVQSIIEQSNPKTGSVDVIFEELQARILSLANAHDILNESGLSALSVREAMEREASPYTNSHLSLSGPDVGISKDAATIFTLVLHELFSNAAKYGAFSNSDGCLDIHWDFSHEGLNIYWKESNGPTVRDTKKAGFGSILIHNAFAYEFGGDTEINFKPSGLELKMFLPSSIIVSRDNIHEGLAQIGFPQTEIGAGVRKPIGNVLVLEDDFLVATQTKQEIDRLGASATFLASSNAEALRILGMENVNFAVLDINLTGERSGAIANMLIEQRIPFIFVTGYDSGEETMREFPDIAIIKKPYNSNKLAEAIFSALN